MHKCYPNNAALLKNWKKLVPETSHMFSIVFLDAADRDGSKSTKPLPKMQKSPVTPKPTASASEPMRSKSASAKKTSDPLRQPVTKSPASQVKSAVSVNNASTETKSTKQSTTSEKSVAQAAASPQATTGKSPAASKQSPVKDTVTHVTQATPTKTAPIVSQTATKQSTVRTESVLVAPTQSKVESEPHKKTQTPVKSTSPQLTSTKERSPPADDTTSNNAKKNQREQQKVSPAGSSANRRSPRSSTSSSGQLVVGSEEDVSSASGVWTEQAREVSPEVERFCKYMNIWGCASSIDASRIYCSCLCGYHSYALQDQRVDSKLKMKMNRYCVGPPTHPVKVTGKYCKTGRVICGLS